MPDNITDGRHRSILQRIARRAMQERGLLPDFSPAALAELEAIGEPARFADVRTRDLKDLIWCSIDNDDSRDLDQLTVAQALPDQTVKIFVAIADVDVLVRKESALDDHAKQNTTSVYTAAEIFPMLPEKLSTNLTSLNYESDRLAVIVEMVIASDGSLLSSDVYRAMVRNHAKLAYNNRNENSYRLIRQRLSNRKLIRSRESSLSIEHQIKSFKSRVRTSAKRAG